MQIRAFEIAHNLKELTKHQTTSLPIACYETTISHHIQGYIPVHWHEELQFVSVIRGEALFQINDEQLVVRAGEGLFINSGCLHMAKDEPHARCTYICINVDPSFLLPQQLYAQYVYPYVQATNAPFVQLVKNKQWCVELLERMHDIQQLLTAKQPFYEIAVINHLTQLWHLLIEHGMPSEQSQVSNVRNQRMKDMLAFIHVHYTEKLTLQQIAQAGKLSRSECCRYFSTIMSTTPMHYLLNYRIQQSLLLLQHPECSITDVAYKVGFSSASHFIERFKKEMGMTPLVYKRGHSS